MSFVSAFDKDIECKVYMSKSVNDIGHKVGLQKT